MRLWQTVFAQTLLMLSCLLLTQGNIAVAAEIQGARFNQDNNKARLVLELTDDAQYQIHRLTEPDRLVLDIQKTTLKTDLKDLPLDNTVIKNLRYSTDRNKFRLVLDLNQPIKFSHFMLFPTERYSYRLVIDMPKPIVGWKQKPRELVAKLVQKTSTSTPKRDIVVVIDPGHGGKDSGALGPTGTKEKMVVLGIARHLKKLFDTEPGYRAELTRSGDYYVGLRERLKKAREAKADLFVSIHADAFHNPKSRGASVYAVSERGASSEAARWLAEKENYSELGHVNLDDKTDRLREVLINLAQTMTIVESLSVGKQLLTKFKTFAQLHHDYVEQAPFVVLKSPDIPSILVETGFISNPQEEANLKNTHYQQKLARAMHHGIMAYFKEHPPEDLYHAPVLKKSG